MTREGEGLKEQAATNAAPAAAPPLESQALAEQIALLAVQAKGIDVQILRVYELVQYTDYFVIASGRSDRHVRSVREHVHDALAEQKIKPQSVEGVEHNQWVLSDYGSVVLHVFYEPVREFYQLEKLWSEASLLLHVV